MNVASAALHDTERMVRPMRPIGFTVQLAACTQETCMSTAVRESPKLFRELPIVLAANPGGAREVRIDLPRRQS